jgi:hypothetical protein
MSRKDYKAIARVIFISDSKEDIITKLGIVFSRDNPRFDLARFEEACHNG